MSIHPFNPLLQENIYDASLPFVSFKSCAYELKDRFPRLQLFSFHSTSKGFTGECGKRGGYLETFNVEDGVLDELYKYASLSLCPNLTGQVCMFVR